MHFKPDRGREHKAHLTWAHRPLLSRKIHRRRHWSIRSLLSQKIDNDDDNNNNGKISINISRIM